MNLFDLTDRVVVVTGASKGMGLAMANAVADHGARVVISSRKLDQCEIAAKALNERVGAERAVPIACNIGYKEQLESLVEETHAKLGPIDVLIANAGVNPYYGPSRDIPDSAFDKIMGSNVRSNHWLCHMVATDMMEKKRGSIVITSSEGAFNPSGTLGTYAISKLADLALIRNLALEYGGYNIRANAICPGLIKTDFSRALWDSEVAKRNAESTTPLGRLGEPEDLAGVAVFLASDASAFMTGQALTVCGGRAMCAAS